MRVLGKRESMVCVGIICDICGGGCHGDSASDLHGEVREYATLKAKWGYFSRKDTEKHECHLCEDCYDRVWEFIETLGGKSRVREYSTMEGLSHLLANQVDFKEEEEDK